MQTCFEHFAATSLLGSEEAPPRDNGALCFSHAWERRAFGLALALSKEGYFEWEQFREALIDSISRWEREHELDDPSWSYYHRWLDALMTVMARSGLVDRAQLGAIIGATELAQG
ncbi:MAG TPA: nitrile hydratase accessory protein [Polyangiaceae bacterium]|nr:nitrile hydratase accessory protein [Polyangiaceae bacterium]